MIPAQPAAPRPTPLPLLLAAAAFCGIAGCSQERPGAQGGSAAEAASVNETGGGHMAVADTSSGAEAASVPLQAVGLVDSNLHIEPPKDDWETEVINDTAGSRLQALARILESGSVTPAELEAITAEAIRSTDLVPVPATTATTFEDTAFKVTAAPDAALQQAGHAGRDAFAQALQVLLAPFSGASERHVKFKIFNVAAASSPTTTAYFEMTGHTADGWLQQNATWECGWAPGKEGNQDLLLVSVAVTGFESSLGKSGADGVLLADCTDAVFAGVKSFREQLSQSMDHWVARVEKQFGIAVSGWHGLALGDVNADGLDDLYVCQPGGLPDRLYVQKPDGTVFDASSLAGVDWRIQSQSALLIDLDNDADQDLVLATTLGVVFMANDGRGTFTVRATHLIPEAAPLALTSADFDLDGDLDVYVGCYSLRRASADGQVLGRPVPYHDANNGGRNVLFRNDLDWQFTDATLDSGLDRNNRRFTLAASWEDYDNDGDPDLYVANDYGRNNLYRNDPHADGGRTFVDVAAAAGVEDISAGMSVSWGDVNLDGNMDLYVSNMWSSAGNRVTYQRQFQQGAGTEAMTAFRRHARGNSLFMNAGDGTFADASLEAGVTMGRWAWGSRFIDLNNDGLEDIYVANGFITQPEDSGDL